MSITLDFQQAYEIEDDIQRSIPSEQAFETWANAVLSHIGVVDKEMTVRIVDEQESHGLNFEYRGKDKSTNVLSFPFECPPEVPIPLLGDLVICAPVIVAEAAQQKKAIADHYAHMVIHGTLHLLGYDHIDDADAEEMEGIEVHILKQLEIDDPYQGI